MSVWAASRMFRVQTAPLGKRSANARPRWITKVIIGGLKAHCCTQLASMPVSTPSRASVRTKTPLGTRPSADARFLCGSAVCIGAFLPSPLHSGERGSLFVVQHLHDDFVHL